MSESGEIEWEREEERETEPRIDGQSDTELEEERGLGIQPRVSSHSGHPTRACILRPE